MTQDITAGADGPPRPPRSRRVVPGFTLAIGTTLLYLTIIVLLPLLALALKTADIGWARFWTILGSDRVLSAFRVTLTAAALATAFNALYGLLMAWVLVRYDFPGKRLLDALMDLPFALPTAVAGISLAAIFAPNGWFGAPLANVDIKIAYTWIGIAIAMAFTAAPFVVRTVQPVLEDLETEVEEAAATLGARPWTIFRRVVFPALLPAWLAGMALSFARALGEFGGIIYIAGNLPGVTEIVSLLIFIRLEEYDYPAAAALASTILVAAFAMLLAVNGLQAWARRHEKVR